MRRIAAHRIYLLPQAEWRSASVIELNEAGEVVRVSPLTEEGAHIEWLSGEIIVSPFPLVRESHHETSKGVCGQCPASGLPNIILFFGIQRIRLQWLSLHSMIRLWVFLAGNWV